MTQKQITFLICFVLFGLYWFVPLLTSTDLADSDFFMATHLYLPGLALPLIVYFALKKIKFTHLLIYVVLTWGIYYLTVQIFSQEFAGSYYFAAFFGALGFLVATDYFLYQKLNFKYILIGAVGGTIVFAAIDVIDDAGFQVACFLWTVIIGVMIVMSNKQARRDN